MDRDDLRFARRVLIALVLVFLTIGLLLLVVFAFHFVLVVFAGILLAVLLDGVVGQITKRSNIPHRAALGLVVVSLLGLLAGFWGIVGPEVAEQFRELQERFPEALREAEDWLLGFGLGQLIVEQAPGAAELLGGLVGHLTGIFTTVFAAVFYTVIVLFIGFYAAANPRLYVENVIHLVRPKHQARFRELMGKVARALRHWFLGQFIAMVAVGSLTTIGLMIIGMPLALTLGFLAGLRSCHPGELAGRYHIYVTLSPTLPSFGEATYYADDESGTSGWVDSKVSLAPLFELRPVDGGESIFIDTGITPIPNFPMELTSDSSRWMRKAPAGKGMAWPVGESLHYPESVLIIAQERAAEVDVAEVKAVIFNLANLPPNHPDGTKQIRDALPYVISACAKDAVV
jgi:hypothetical protein